MTGKIRKSGIFILILCMTCLLYIPIQGAQEPEFRLDMDSLNLKKGASTGITVSMINAQGAKVFNVEGLDNFDVLSQSTRSSTSIVNTNVSYEENIYYTVMPKTTGQFTLTASILYDGKYYTTNTLQVNISESSANDDESAPNLFVKTILSHSDAYLGEKVVLTYELYSRYNIENYGFTDYIAIDGMIAKDMPDDQLKAEYVYLDGNKYVKYEVKQMIIDPIKSGVYTIPSFNLQVNVITNNNSSGGFGFFFNTTEAMYLQTEARELTVKPLPAEGKPANFSGIVGDLKIDSSYSRQEMNYGDSFTLQATAYGNCNLDGLKNIISGEIQDFTIYETQKNIIESINDNQYHAQKAYEVIIVPEKTGYLDFTPKPITYFNPVSEKYEYAEINAATVNVLGNAPQSGNSTGNSPAITEALVIDQVNYADISADFFTLQLNKDKVRLVIALFAAAIIISLVLILFISKRKRRDTTLKSIYKQIMSSKDINEVYNLFNSMIKHCYDVSIKASSKHTIQNNLPDANLAAGVTDIMDYMEKDKSSDEKAYVYLRDMVKGVYKMILLHH